MMRDKLEGLLPVFEELMVDSILTKSTRALLNNHAINIVFCNVKGQARGRHCCRPTMPFNHRQPLR